MKRATERKQRENFFFASHAINAKLVCSNESNKPVGLGHSVNFVLQRLVLTKDFDNFFFRFFSLNFFLAVLKSKQQSFGFFFVGAVSLFEGNYNHRHVVGSKAILGQFTRNAAIQQPPSSFHWIVGGRKFCQD